MSVATFKFTPTFSMREFNVSSILSLSETDIAILSMLLLIYVKFSLISTLTASLELYITAHMYLLHSVYV